jgi:hypothetical protein
MLTAAFVIAGASLLPFTSVSADALNPLTDRSLTLSSSAPGWDFKDGSGNDTYADPNSGANGKKTGNTFSFKVSSDSTANAIEAFTFQYCTAPAGTCTSPGNNGTVDNGGTPERNDDDVAGHKSDLNINYTDLAVDEVDNSTTPVFNTGTGVVTDIPNKDGSAGHYIVMTSNYDDSTDTYGTWQQSSGWVLNVGNEEDGQDLAVSPDVGPTGKNNFMTLTKAGGVGLPAKSQVKIVFFGTEDNYITNPGKGAFFVKINTWNDETGRDQDANLIDGGVTVANVMNLGISIQTKVLETMDFSVGTVDPYTLSTAQLTTATQGARTAHGTCDPVLNMMDPTDTTKKANTLLLGSEANENSLNTDTTYSTHSYFRLSSNASAGATVYYSGVTLSNTVGDVIKPIGATKDVPKKGTEQFGLALANNSGTSTADPLYKVNYATERKTGHVYESAADNTAAGLVALNETGTPGATGVDTTWTPTGGQKLPQLTVFDDGSTQVALAPEANYNQGAGIVNPVDNVYDNDPTPSTVSTTGSETKFAFDDTSNLIPVAIASENDKVVDCASAKVRYIANIAATTPAGIYTTKINYIAAPQY